MLTAAECRALAAECKRLSQASDISNDRAFLLRNVGRSLKGVATQLDMLAAKTREEALEKHRQPCVVGYTKKSQPAADWTGAAKRHRSAS
jgi:hypothetical protein